jgi:branched-chain amino acid aminotransferase
VKFGKGNSLYIRPFMIAIGSGVIAQPSSQYRFMIILSPAKSYYSGEVKVIIAEHFSRAANGGIGAAKAAGNYSAQFYPTKLANEQGYQQIIWTDDATHTKLEEAGTMNVFFRIGDTLLTAPTSERILDGITRKSVLDIAKRDNIKTEVRSVLVEELVAAAKNGTLKEIFGAGTAAVINPIVGFSFRDEYFELPKLENSFALDIKEKLNNIQYKLDEKPTIGLITAAVPAPKISFNVPFFAAATSSSTKTERTSVLILSLLAISKTDFLVIPSKILSEVGAVNKVSPILKNTFMVPASSNFV